MNKKHQLSLSIQFITLGVAGMLMGVTAPVYAQSPAAEDNIEETLVTGSRIKRPDLTSNYRYC
jgi:hypothetical protein